MAPWSTGRNFAPGWAAVSQRWRCAVPGWPFHFRQFSKVFSSSSFKVSLAKMSAPKGQYLLDARHWPRRMNICQQQDERGGILVLEWMGSRGWFEAVSDGRGQWAFGEGDASPACWSSSGRIPMV